MSDNRTAEDLIDEMMECVHSCDLGGKDLDDYVAAFMSDPPEEAYPIITELRKHLASRSAVERLLYADLYHSIERSIVRWEVPRA